MRKLLIAFLICGFTSVLNADTVLLTNGRSFNGIVTEQVETARPSEEKDERLYRVFFGSTDYRSEEYKGYIDVEKKNVESVEENDLDSF